ncbi:MAG TPA: peptide ABC transporter substrate-binding protein [Gammaproteobacteria bacterium]
MTPVSCRTAFVVGFACLSLLAACSEAPDGVRVLRIGNQAEPASLDPHRSEGVPARNIQRDLFEGLMAETAAGELVGGVAQKWSVSKDGLEWTFHLRADARWSNGDPVTANDFVFSFRRAVTPATGGIVSETLLPIKNAAGILRGAAAPETLGVRAPEPRTLVVELNAPTPYFLATLTHPSTFPVHPETVQATEHWARPGTLVSNGAYRLIEWQVNSHILLEKNPHYRDAENVAIERVAYLPIDDQRSELARFTAGDVHITYSVPPGRLGWLRENYGKVLRIHPWFGVYYLGLNTTRAPLDDVRVRRALSMVIDRKLLAREIVASGETPAFGWIPPIGNYKPPQPDWAAWPMEKRHAAARALLVDAGYGPEEPVTVEMLYNTRDRDRRVVTAVAAMWKQQLGVETRLRNEEWKVYLQTRQQREKTQVFRSGWIGEYPDPNSFAEILHSEHGMNEFGWNNPRYDALIEQAATTRDAQKRLELFSAAAREVNAEVPLIPLFHYAKARLVSPSVGGYTGNLMDHHYTKHLFWIE